MGGGTAAPHRDPAAVPRRIAKTHAKGTRTFLGFPDAELRQLLRGFGERVLGPPTIRSVQDAHLVPLVAVAQGRYIGGVFAGGVYQSSLVLHRGHNRKRDARVRQPEQGPSRSTTGQRLGRAWFGGYLTDHYGHFLLEGLARVLDPEIAASTDPVIFFNANRIAELRPYMRAVFARVGIDPARILLCDEPLSVEELRFQEPTFEIRGFVRPAAYARIQRSGGAARSSGMAYLSRSGLIGDRTIEGEAGFEDWLAREMGANMFAPQQLSFEAQLEKLEAAQFILGCEGSAFHSLIFLARAPDTVMLCGGPPNINYLLCDELFDGDTIYVRTSLPTDGAVDRMRWTLDVGAAKRAARFVTGSRSPRTASAGAAERSAKFVEQ